MSSVFMRLSMVKKYLIMAFFPIPYNSIACKYLNLQLAELLIHLKSTLSVDLPHELFETFLCSECFKVLDS